MGQLNLINMSASNSYTLDVSPGYEYVLGLASVHATYLKLVDGAGDNTIRGDMVDEMDAAREYFADLDGFDTSTLSIETSKVIEGNDVILGGDGVDDIDSGDGENFVSSGRLELETEGETDLETLRDHIKSHKDIFDDDDWI